MQLKTFCPFPVGYVYLSADGTSPGTLFPNTSWEQIQGKFLFASDATRSAGDTGGSEAVTLTTDQIPSHSHSVGAHAHGLNSHTHSVGAHAHGLNSHTHGVGTYAAASGGAHKHKIATHRQYGTGSGTDGTTSAWKIGRTQSNADGGGIRYTGPGDAQAGENEGSHSHSITGTSGAASGSTANSAAFNSGGPSTANTANSAAFDSGAAGGGSAHSNMPPYLTVNVWKRVA